MKKISLVLSLLSILLLLSGCKFIDNVKTTLNYSNEVIKGMIKLSEGISIIEAELSNGDVSNASVSNLQDGLDNINEGIKIVKNTTPPVEIAIQHEQLLETLLIYEEGLIPIQAEINKVKENPDYQMNADVLNESLNVFNQADDLLNEVNKSTDKISDNK